MSAMWAGLEVERTDMEEARTSEGAVRAANRKSKDKKTGKGRIPLKDKTNSQHDGDEDMEDNDAIAKSKHIKAPKQTINDQDVVKMTFQVPSSLSQEAREKIRHITLSFPAQQLKKVDS